MADGWSHKSNGKLEQMLRRMTGLEQLPSYAARVGTQATTGVLRRKRTADEIEVRDAGRNMIALRMNAKLGRNAMTFSSKEIGEGTSVWGKGTMSALRTGSVEALAEYAKKVSEFMAARVRAHLAAGAATRGEFTTVKRGTQRRKDREGLRPGLPPMTRTGQLQRALLPETRKLKR